MDLTTLAFFFFAALTLGFGAVVVLSRNIMHAAFSLLFTFFGVAGLYVMLHADFLAITQIMIYIGGILVLIIFGVMLTTRITGVDVRSGRTGKLQLGLTAALSVTLAAVLVKIFLSTQWHIAPAADVDATAELIGNAFLTKYLLAFEAASILLLVAIVGAAFIARKK